jgi:hypothetical protein
VRGGGGSDANAGGGAACDEKQDVDGKLMM